jgi:hypothetical protein
MNDYEYLGLTVSSRGERLCAFGEDGITAIEVLYLFLYKKGSVVFKLILN